MELFGLFGKFGRTEIFALGGLTVDLEQDFIMELFHGLEFGSHLVEHGCMKDNRFCRGREKPCCGRKGLSSLSGTGGRKDGGGDGG